jgi:phage major head subunit gpT-like protein
MAINTLLTKGLLTNFFEGYNGAQVHWDKVATKVPSTARSETYGWLGSVPRLREMKGERAPKKLLEYSYSITNKEFEASIEVDHADLKDDQTGQYGILARSIGEAAKTYPDELVFAELLPNGETNLCYDGQLFFDTDHPVGETGATQSNKITTALDATAFNTARGMLRTMKDDYGRPTFNNNMDLLLVVPPALESTAQTILEADFNANGATNVYKGNARILVANWLSDTTNWYLLNTAGTIKPFIVQEREFIPFESLEDGSEPNFMRKKNYYGTYWRGNAGYGLYQKAIGAIVAG